TRWADFERLFESRGGPKYCWCMAWRAERAETGLKGPERKSAMRKRVEDGVPVGILGYLDGEPVASCSIAPRSTFRGLGGAEMPDERLEDVWSITCFFAKRDLRKQGITRRLIQAAADHARANGAKVLEGLSGRSRFAQLSLHGLRFVLRGRRFPACRPRGQPQARDAPRSRMRGA